MRRGGATAIHGHISRVRSMRVALMADIKRQLNPIARGVGSNDSANALEIIIQKLGHYFFSLIILALSRCQSRFLITSRFSYSFLPVARPRLTLAMSRRLK